MQEILISIIENPLAAILFASPIVVVVFGAIYQAFLKIALSPKNIDKLSDAVDKMVDKIQRKDPDAGKLNRKKIIATCEEIIKRLKEAYGIN